MHKLKLLKILISSLFLNQLVYSQNDMNLLDAVEETKEKKIITATFKTTKLVNIQTVEQVKRGELDFRISHRFDDIAGASGGVKTLYGFDNVTDIRICWYNPFEKTQKEKEKAELIPPSDTPLCSACDKIINEAEKKFSISKFNKQLCRECQREESKKG